MFALAVSIGILSYTLMGLGLLGILLNKAILIVTLIFLSTSPLWFPSPNLGEGTKRRGIFLYAILIIQILVNLVGALGPELGFDALWYHTTVPKIWLTNQKITFLWGDLYYSGLPKLIDMLYVYPGSQLIHFSFGILTLLVIYKMARKYLNSTYSLLACIIFYSNLVVGWQSITAYIDLGRTFFEILALYLFVEKKYFQTAVILGLAISTKILALGSLVIFGFLGFPIIYFLISIIIPLPWLLFNYLNTGNPVYPIFSSYPIDWNFSINILRLADPINPIYVMVTPLIPPLKLRGGQGVILIYCILSFVIWFLTPHSGGGRFLMPYLPAWSILTAILIQKNKFFITMAIVLAIVSLGYRGIANAKYIPYLLGVQTKQEFLNKYLYDRFR
ncbi:hypothetical protein HZB69_04725 [Candidatus Amesbacteria bacterium]|nr:hypothetical protein [Candidatus Amesbacteria bacterium]